MKPFIAYHGSPNKFNSFSLSTFGKHDAGMYGEGIYLTDKKEVALGFSEGGYLYKCQVNLNNPLIIDANEPQEVADLVMDKGSKEATKELKNKGYDGIIVKDESWYIGSGDDESGFITADQYIIFDPKNIKILKVEDLSSSKNGNNMLNLEEAINMIGKKFTLDESIADNGINNMDASGIDEDSKEHIEVPFQYANAIKDHKKKIKQSIENTKGIVKMADEVVKENDRDAHKVPKTEPLKKMRLSEDLFEDYKEETLNEDEPIRRQNINLLKYGFVRAPQEDFVDDGDKFTGYYFDPEKKGDTRIVVTKLVDYAGDEAYISAGYYNDETGRTIYFDDLNGVSVSNAIKDLPKLTQDLKAFLEKVDAGEVKAVEFSDEDIDDIVATAVKMPNKSVEEIAKDMGFDLDKVKKEVRDNINKKVTSGRRNARSYSPDIIKKLASQTLDYVLKSLKEQQRYNWNTKRVEFVEPKDLETILKNIEHTYGDIGIPSETDKYKSIHLSDLPESTVEKIKTWVRNKVDSLYDFE